MTGTTASFSGDVRIGGATEATSWHTVSILTGGFIAQYEGTNINRGVFSYASATELQIGAYDYGSASTGYKELHLVTNSLKVTAAAGATFTGGIAATGAITSTDGLLSNYHQLYNTGTTGFLIATNIPLTTNYGFILGEIKLEQFNLSTQQIINFSATILATDTVYTKAATADIPVTIKLFNYSGYWYIHVPSPSTFTTISAYINLGGGYQGTTRSSNVITAITAAAVPSSGVTNSTNIVAQQRILADTSGKIAIGNNIPMWSGSYGGALVLKGNNATADRYAQLGIVNSTGTLVYTGLVVDTVGKVGIGITNPGYLLEVNGTTYFNGASVVNGQMTASLGHFENSSHTIVTIKAQASGNKYSMLQMTSNGTQDNYIRADVGDLVIDGSHTSVNITKALAVTGALTGTTATFSGALTGLRAAFTGANGTSYVLHLKNTTAATPYTCWIEEPASATAGYPLLSVTPNGGSSPYFRIDSGGNTWLKGSTYVAKSSGLAPLTLLSNPANQVADIGGELIFQATYRATSDTTPVARIKGSRENATTNNWKGKLTFHTSPGGDSPSASTERMRINGDGKVGIGITNPGTLLEVNGSFKAGGNCQLGDSYSDSHSIYGPTTVLAAAGSTPLTANQTATGAGWEALLDLKRDGVVDYRIQSNSDMVIVMNTNNTSTAHMWYQVNGAYRLKLNTTGYVDMDSESQVRLTLGSQGTAGNNDSNWIRGNGTSLGFNAAGGATTWEVSGVAKMRLAAAGDLKITRCCQCLSFHRLNPNQWGRMANI